MRTFYALAGILFLFAGCSDPFEYHPNEIILAESERDLNKKNMAEILKKQPSDTICFVLMGDTQRFYDQLEVFSKSVASDKEVEFIIHSGDISDFGWAKEFKWVHRLMKTIPIPYLTVIGNHDLLANGRNVYLQMYGPTNYIFDYGFIRFVFFDSNSLEHQFNGKVPDLDWISRVSDLSELPNIKQVINISHIPPFGDDFDPDLIEPYINHCASHPNLNLSLHGHHHRWQEKKPAGEELLVHTAGTIKKRTYTKVKVWKDGYNLKKVDY